MGDESLESGITPDEWGDTGEIVEHDEVAVMLRLLSPPTVPDTVWFSHATRALVQCNGRRLLTRPGEHRGCKLLIECLAAGAYRSQSAVLDFLREVATCPDGGSLDMMAEDEGMPVIKAALCLCREQPAARGDDGDGQQQVAAGIDENALDCDLAAAEEEEEGGGAEYGDIVVGRSGARDGVQDGTQLKGKQGEKEEEEEEEEVAPPRRILVRQNCCEDPFDCEEPAVREAALGLVSTMAERICLARRCAEPGGEDSCALSLALLPILGGGEVLRDVLEAMQVSSISVSRAAGRALSKLLLVPMSPRSIATFSKFLAKSLGNSIVDEMDGMRVPWRNGASATASREGDAKRQKVGRLGGERHAHGQDADSGWRWDALWWGVVALDVSELPKTCCMSALSLRSAICDVARELAGSCEGRRCLRDYGLIRSLLPLVRSDARELASKAVELVVLLCRTEGAAECILPPAVDGGGREGGEECGMLSAASPVRVLLLAAENMDGDEAMSLAKHACSLVLGAARTMRRGQERLLVSLSRLASSSTARLAEKQHAGPASSAAATFRLLGVLQDGMLACAGLGEAAERMMQEKEGGEEGEGEAEVGEGRGEGDGLEGWCDEWVPAAEHVMKRGRDAPGRAGVMLMRHAIKALGRMLRCMTGRGSGGAGGMIGGGGERCWGLVLGEAKSAPDPLCAVAAIDAVRACIDATSSKIAPGFEPLSANGGLVLSVARPVWLHRACGEAASMAIERKDDPHWEVRDACLRLSASCISIEAGYPPTRDAGWTGRLIEYARGAVGDAEGYVRASALFTLRAGLVTEPGRVGWEGLVEKGAKDCDALVRRESVSLLTACLGYGWGVSFGISQAKRWRDIISRLAVDVDWEVGVKVMRLCQTLALGGGVESGEEDIVQGGGGGRGVESGGSGREGVERGCVVLFAACASEALVGGMSSADKPVRVSACQAIVEIMKQITAGTVSFDQPLDDPEADSLRRAFAAGIRGWDDRARGMLVDAESKDEVSMDLAGGEEGQLECPD